MKKIKLFTNNKFYSENLFFYGFRWSIFITAYVLIAVIMVFGSENYFKEGICAAQVAYRNSASDKITKESVSTEEPDSEDSSLEQEAGNLTDKAINENNAVENAFAQDKSSVAVSCINQNVLDSAVAEQTVIEKKEVEAQKKESAKKQKEATEAFNTNQSASAKIKLSSKDKKILQRIVEAEATGESIKGKMLVANVVLNRVNSPKFPNTIEGVVFQKSGSVYQFSPIKDGRYYKVSISDETKEAVERVLNGEDESQGALFFMSRSKSVSGSVTWFDTKLCRVFKYGTHEFYK